MAIASSDLLCYFTGATSDGGAQASAAACLGNYRSSTQLTDNTDGNLFDDVSGAEASAGDTEYRCLCFKNNHGSLSLQAAVVYMAATGAADDVISFAVEVPTGGDTNGYAQTIADESTTPTVNAGNCSNWSTATTRATGVSVAQGAHDNKLDAGEIVFVWVKRAVTAGAAAVTAESFQIMLVGDTAA